MSDHSFPQTGRIAGIDYGSKRIGVALSDPDRVIASPWETYVRSTGQADAEYFRRLANDERLVGFVVGLPVHMSGEESGKSAEARAFGGWLSEVTGRPVCFHDERYSTAEATRLLDFPKRGRKHHQKLVRDAVAAQVILSSYLETGRPTPPRSLDGEKHI